MTAAANRLPPVLQNALRVPVIASPMFIVSGPDLVIAECLSGVVGAFPALNARAPDTLDGWLTRIETELAAAKAADPARRIAPYAVNQIVHASNNRLEEDMETCVAHQVPIIITSLRPPGEIVRQAHSYGGVVFHDVISVRHAEKALEAGADGLILVCTGAGGHAGTLSPFALLGEVRRFYDGPIVLSGSITTGDAVLAAQAMGADLAYMGTRFIASKEANAAPAYKEMIATSAAAFTGVHGNYLKPSIIAAGLDPDNLPPADKTSMDFSTSSAKAWRDIWGSGQGVGPIQAAPPVAALVDRLAEEYRAARTRLAATAATFG